MQPTATPELRLQRANDAPVRPHGDHVLYWMTAARRARHNFALDRAVSYARQLNKPLIVLEALRCGYHQASDRLHRFVLEGMADNAAAFAGSCIRYYPYVETEEGAGSGLLAALAEHACVVVTDDFPCFFLPRMVEAAASRISVLLEEVDSNGLVPMRAPGDRVFSRAVDLRRWLQNHLPEHLPHTPNPDPLAGLELPRARLARKVTDRWPAATKVQLAGDASFLATLPIDHEVGPAHLTRGGSVAGSQCLEAFLGKALDHYDEDRNHPDRDGSSGLSPWLHFGHISAHQVFADLVGRQGWDLSRLGDQRSGSRGGFWNMSAPAEAFLDQLITWRELGFNMCSKRSGYDRYESLPEWAQRTLEEHASDPRPHQYSFEQLDEARTHDEIWNAAQTELRREGRMQNYLRMLWGKKVLEWSPSPRVALETLITLNNRYALDGRDPNSYSGIFWVFGRYDRAWGPERPVFGKVRYMTSDSTRRKVRLKAYLEQYGSPTLGLT